MITQEILVLDVSHRALNFIALTNSTSEIWIEHEKRNFISTSNHVLFIYHHKYASPLLTGEAGFVIILSSNKNREVENMHWITAKTNNGPNFQYTNSQVLNPSLPTEEIFQVHSQTRPVGIRPVLCYEKCHYQSHWIRNFRFFFAYFGFLPLLGKFERHCL